ncbi:MAG TPA: FKBP-type peptidyl-prolyl cis-trans isomerase [Candidatus Bathyarchaeia archaeon]|nr:FKBP-type peptidyl-prolyl cis-trans isomerase [Candidatus Bathyarchaeia archaeon]
MALQKGDFILINYTAKVKETNEIFDTTVEETAKKEHLQKEGEICEPKLIVIGEGWVLKALDDSLTTMEPSKPSMVEIPPEKAFGPRDSEKVKRVHLKQLIEKGINPAVGTRIEFGGKNATIRSIGAGRVLLDFNPPLAGKTLAYEVTLNKKLESNEEKIAALIHRRIPIIEEAKFKFVLQENALTVDMPEESYYVEGVQIAKRGVAMDIQKFFPDITETKFVETFKTPPKPTEATPNQTKPAEGKPLANKES